MDRVTHSEDETRHLGKAIGQALKSISLDQPLVITLDGELGAGKTTFVSGVLRALGISAPVRSPTYTLVEPYEFGSFTVYHLDLYRLVEARELEMLALRDLLRPQAVLLIEWAERGKDVLPAAELSLTFNYLKEGDRQVQIRAMSMRAKELAASVQG